MNSNPKLNLSDEALSELLAQPADASANSEVQAMQSALRSYRTETLVWAERRSAASPSLVPRTIPNRWAAVPQWSLAAVAMVAVAAGVVHFAGYGAEDVAPAANPAITASSSATSSAADIAADNQLLGSIDQALRYDRVAPATESQTRPAKGNDRGATSSVSPEVID